VVHDEIHLYLRVKKLQRNKSSMQWHRRHTRETAQVLDFVPKAAFVLARSALVVTALIVSQKSPICVPIEGNRYKGRREMLVIL
jgi:hypothetical protein